MAGAEFRPPSPEELFRRITGAGRTPQQFMDMLDVLYQGIHRGVIRDKISCWENKELFFDMVRRSYDPTTRDHLGDAEIGIHLAQCAAPTCGRLQRAYFERPGADSEEELGRVGARYMEDLAREIVTGREIPELEGQKSNWVDSDTGLVLPIAKAVDITVHCVARRREERKLFYMLPQRGPLVELEHTNVYDCELGKASVALWVESLDPKDEVFKMHAQWMRIDPGILFEIVHANAPRTQG